MGPGPSNRRFSQPSAVKYCVVALRITFVVWFQFLSVSNRYGYPDDHSRLPSPKPDGYQTLIIKEAALPPPKTSEVLVKIHAVSLQYRDIVLSTGQLYPLGNVVLCSDMAGEVIAVGSDVDTFSGDRVCANFSIDHVFGDPSLHTKNMGLGVPIDGVLTEYKSFPAHCLVHIPSHLSYVEASTLPCAALTAYNALHGPTPIKAGDVVLVQGTGGVSIFALQLAKVCGAQVIATSSSDEKLKISKNLGADYTINYTQIPAWDEEVLKITNGRGVDHVIEVGGSGTLIKSLNAVRFAGWVHIIGILSDPGDASNAPMAALGKGAMMRGIRVGSRVQFEKMNRLITANTLEPLVDKVFNFEDAKEAYAYLESQKHVGKVCIQVAKD